MLIFFIHTVRIRETPIEETMGALDFIVRSGRALYAGISNYSPEQTERAVEVLRNLGTPCLIHQPKYSMFVRTPEEGLLDVLDAEGIGAIVFSPLAQGLLTDRYLHGIPEGSRAAKPGGYLKKDQVTEAKINKARLLNALAAERGQSLAQMALAWLLRDERVTSVLIGASSVNQLEDNLATLKNYVFTEDELVSIEEILG